MKTKLLLLLAALWIFPALFFVRPANGQAAKCGESGALTFGLTTESIKDLGKLNHALDRIRDEGGCIPTLRVVFQPEVSLNEYAAALETIRGADAQPKHAYIVGLLVDSYHYKFYDIETLRRRAREFAEELYKHVDVWEVGNEINGSWVKWKGETPKICKKAQNVGGCVIGTMVRTAYQEIKLVFAEKNSGEPEARRRNPKFVLNLYFNDDNIESEKGYYEGGDPAKKRDTKFYSGNNCRPEPTRSCDIECSHDYEMFTWAKKFLDVQGSNLKFDYVLFSFYRDDCHVPTYPALWARVFEKIEREFTVKSDGKTFRPKVGFGEVAPQCHCSKDKNGDRKNDNETYDDDNEARIDPCCRPEQPAFVREYYEMLHADVRSEITKLEKDKRPDYVGGFFYWYFHQDAISNDKSSRAVLDALIKAAKSDAWNK